MQSRHPIRRVLIQLVVCLLLGAVVTVGVAWALALTRPMPNGAISGLGTGAGSWPGEVPTTWPRAQDHLAWAGRGTHLEHWAGNTERRGVRPIEDLGKPWVHYNFDRAKFGWPWLSLSATRVEEWDVRGQKPIDVGLPRSVWKRGIVLPRTPSGTFPQTFGALPLEPLWLPFLGDTVVFAAPIALLWLVVPRLVRALRRREYQCRRCGYDLRGLPAGADCPECGSMPGE